MPEKKSTKVIREKATMVRRKLVRHNYLYYVLAQPEISDQAYDFMYKQLLELELQYPDCIVFDSPTQRVGGESLEGFQSVQHAEAMLSLDNTYAIEELEEWVRRVEKALPGEKTAYLVELKIDGVAIALQYENRRLVRAVTRGDGETGDDVTDNIKTIRTLSVHLPVLQYPWHYVEQNAVTVP